MSLSSDSVSGHKTEHCISFLSGLDMTVNPPFEENPTGTSVFAEKSVFVAYPNNVHACIATRCALFPFWLRL